MDVKGVLGMNTAKRAASIGVRIAQLIQLRLLTK